MIETNLSMKDFTKYFENDRLKTLSFPNGRAYVDHDIGKFFVDLKDLYKLVTGWKINHTEVPLDDIVGVIAFGSAVQFPGYNEITTKRKKYFLFGPYINLTEKIPLIPKDADFFVLTEKDLTREKLIEPEVYLDGYGGATITKGGIHLINRGIEQVLNGVKAKDTVSISALEKGVPIFYDERLKDIQEKSKIKKSTPRKVYWDTDDNSRLYGKIL